jgi:hypothetical protein
MSDGVRSRRWFPSDETMAMLSIDSEEFIGEKVF